MIIKRSPFKKSDSQSLRSFTKISSQMLSLHLRPSPAKMISGVTAISLARRLPTDLLAGALPLS